MGLVVIRPQETQEPAHLHERLATGILDRTQSGASLLRARVEDALRGGRLGHDHADVMRHHVMQFSGDHAAFLGHRLLRRLLALARSSRVARSSRLVT